MSPFRCAFRSNNAPWPHAVLFARCRGACCPVPFVQEAVLTWCGPPDCDTCSFLSCSRSIVFIPFSVSCRCVLQLCDMSATVLDTCEGEVQGKRPPPRLPTPHPPAGPPRSAPHPACGSHPHAASARCLPGLRGSCQAGGSFGFWSFFLVLSGWGGNARQWPRSSAPHAFPCPVSSPVLSLWLSSGGITDLFFTDKP